MPTEFFFTDSIDDPRQTLTAGEGAYVRSGVLVGSVNDAALVGTTSNHQFTIDGDVFGYYYGIQNNDDASRGNVVTVGLTGTVSSDFHSGIWMSGGDHTIVNYGQIRGGGNGITMYTTSTTTESTIVNHGIIHGDHTGIGRQNSDARETLNITNYGTIYGGSESFSYSAGDAIERIVNKGLMIGDVMLGDNNDLYDGRAGTLEGVADGGEGNDALYGGAADDRLFGQDGNDTLMGGAGADQLAGGAGADIASYASATSSVIVSLFTPALNTGDAFGDAYSGIENLVGSSYNDYVYGNNANNVINAGAGNDIIKGFAGNDVVAGGVGNDYFIFNTALNGTTNVDRITDFSVFDDTIQLENAIFTGLATGVLAPAAFAANATGIAGDASDRVIYEFDTGKLYFDADGTGAGARVQFATLAIGLGLTAADFVVI